MGEEFVMKGYGCLCKFEVVVKQRILKLTTIVGGAVFLGTIWCNMQLIVMGVPNMADYENEDDLVPYNGKKNVEDVEYNDIDDDFAPH